MKDDAATAPANGTSREGAARPVDERGIPNLLPARMLNELAYCPRLFHIEWVQREFADNAWTADGRFQHRRVDQGEGRLPHPDAEDGDADADDDGQRPLHTRSVWLSAPDLRLTARIDLVESGRREAAPVDYKRGSPPDVEHRAWEPERVQACAQGLILRENGYHCSRAFLYFTGSKERVEVPLTDDLVRRTLDLRDRAFDVASRATAPAPLVDSPKCPGCSLVGVCLPDEINGLNAASADGEAPKVRRIVATRTDAQPLYVQRHGLRIRLAGSELKVMDRRQEVRAVRLLDVSQVSVFGNVQITTQALCELARREIPISFFTYGGWFRAIAHGQDHANVEVRRRQFAVAADAEEALAIARPMIEAKIRNGRVMLRRNHRDPDPHLLTDLSAAARRAGRAKTSGGLLGFEGTAARLYFGAFEGMIKRDAGGAFDFRGRNRRPPRDPVNAMLSLAYAMLAKDATAAVRAAGFDPYMGFFHQPRYGRPSLALDLMEEFRPIVADSVVLSVINNGIVGPDDFAGGVNAVNLRSAGRARFIRAYERRMDELVTHPVFGYRISYRRVIEVQARLLARLLLGDLDAYPAFRTR